jgi:hypothetical protein
VPLDHFVSQVHLKNFYSPALAGQKLMHAIRKRDCKRFQCRAKDVCRIENGSTNDFLLNNRVIEDFLNFIEPSYNKSVEKFRSGKIDADSIFVVAGFISYVASCSPTAMRIHSEPLGQIVETTANFLDKKGVFPPSPPALGGRTLSDLLRDGTIEVLVDGKYPQSFGITTILERTTKFGNFDWDILLNGGANSPLFTSDFPVAIERSDDPRILNRIVPLALDLAVRIKPSLDQDREKGNMSFPYFRSRRHELSHAQNRAINKLIVRCAEELESFTQLSTCSISPMLKREAPKLLTPHNGVLSHAGMAP